MKRAALLLLIMASACSAPVRSTGRESDAARIASAVLRHEAAIPREHWTCVAPRTDGVALDHARSSLLSLEAERRANPRQWKAEGTSSGDRPAPFYPWRKPGAEVGGSDAPLLDEAEGRPLSEAAEAVVRDPAQPSSMPRVEWAWVPARLRGWFGTYLCPARLRLTAPAFRGDIAFAEVVYACGGYCGYSAIYVLRHRDEDWTIVATALTGVS